jgi:hypothetical protein
MADKMCYCNILNIFQQSLYHQSGAFSLCKVVINVICFDHETVLIKKMAVFWVVAPCSLTEVYQRFRGPCCLHHQGDE